MTRIKAMARIRDYRAGDAAKVRAQAAQQAEAAEAAAGFEQLAAAYSLVEDGTGGEAVLAVFGYRIDDEAPDGAECFAFVGRNAGRGLLAAVRFLKRKTAAEAARLNVRRITMTVKADFAAGARLARLLGFRPAGRLADFFNGETYQLFERIEDYGNRIGGYHRGA